MTHVAGPGAVAPLSGGSLRRLAAASAILVLSLTACTAQDSLAQQANAGDNKNYVAGDGSVTEFTPEKRSSPVAVSATLFDGTKINSGTWKGEVTVLNFWYAACAPCRLEARDLQALHVQFQDKGAQFYGVNIRDEQATAESYERTFGITYPSVLDRDGGVVQSLTTFVPPQAVPTTLVIDKQGRVAGRILGVADKTTLKTLISSALGEK